ncbi:MAG: trypsin-like peptidase domain-containing protein [Acidobacteriaceae bacterium]|nr:trypsin-like peptidase domain-containing protein [Acidobacteriaceae bacterium]
MKHVIRTALQLSVLLTTPGFGVTASAQTTKSKPPADMQESLHDPWSRADQLVESLIKKVSPSVVQIMVTSYGPLEEAPGRTGERIGQQRVIGSGFILDPEGYIATNAHVVKGAERIQVVLQPPDADGSLASALSSKVKIVPASIVGQAPEIDIALLKIDPPNLPALPLAAYRNLRQGQSVFAFGSPEGLRNTVTHGLVSAVARQIDPDSPLIYVQTDAPVNPGNSGGPLVNVDGEVVGMNTFIVSQSGGNEGLGFAIPCATVRTVCRQLKTIGHVRRQEIGIGIQAVNPVMADALKLPRSYGVIISDVVPGAPAQSAGLAVGDLLVSINGQPADNLPTVSYYFLLGDFGEKIPVVVQRGATQLSFNVPVREEKHNMEQVISRADPAKNLVSPLGIVGLDIDLKVASMVSGLRSPFGIIVAAKVSASGTDVPLLTGDVIFQLNGQQVTSIENLRRMLSSLPPGAPVVLQIQRDDRLQYLSFTLD